MTDRFFRSPVMTIAGQRVSGMNLEVLLALKKVTDSGPAKVQELANHLHHKYEVAKLYPCLEGMVKLKLVRYVQGQEIVRGFISHIVRYELTEQARASIVQQESIREDLSPHARTD